MYRTLAATLVALFAVVALLTLTSGSPQAQASHTGQVGGTPTSEPLPSGAVIETVLANITSPVSLAFDGEDRIFYTELGGAVRLYEDGALQPQPVITFTGGFEDPGEGCIDRRLIGIALDPNFTANRYIYVSITDAIDCDSATNKVIRFEENGGVGVNPTTIFTSTQTGTVHGINNIGFGPDGKLYVSLGDDFNAPNAQDVSVKAGKLHRINPDGTIPADNPVFTQTGALPSLYAMGLRNSFDFTFDTVGGGVRLFMSENGPECDDELNLIRGAHNYGWRAGYPCDDSNPDPTYNTIPPRWYASEAIAPTGIEVYTGTAIGPWRNELFMCNYQDSTLRHFTLSADRTQVTGVATIEGLSCNMDVETGPDGALYYIEDGGYAPGSIKRVRWVEPVACAVMSGQIVPSPNGIPPSSSTLTDVSALSPTDAWAVGHDPQGCLTLHWNGINWIRVPCPSGATVSVVLALAANDVWAVGGQYNQSRPYSMHWDGVQWSEVFMPSTGGDTNIRGISASSPNNIWVVGNYLLVGENNAFAMRWDGTQWNYIGAPGPSLHDVAVLSLNDVWALSTIGIFRYNGQTWQNYPIPIVSSLESISANSPTDIWAVGHLGNDAIALHWDGTLWSQVPVPNVGDSSLLIGVEAVSPSDVWAVGWYNPGTLDLSYALVMHWDGMAWNTVATPPTVSGVAQLRGISVGSSSAIWAVGTIVVTGSESPQLLIERWDGMAWSIISSNNTLRDIDLVEASDGWAVGWTSSINTATSAETLVLGGNSTGWAVVPSPNRYAAGSGVNFLYDVEAIEGNDVWAVGYAGTPGGSFETFILHWNGTQWTIIPSPNVPGVDNALRGVDALATNDVWAVGYYTDTATTAYTVRPLTLRWNGSQWNSVPGPDFGPDTDARLIGVKAFAPDDVWAVGNFQPTPSGMEETLILHWNGTAWSRVPSPNVNGVLNFLRGVAGATPDDVWAVGYYGSPSRVHLLHWNGSQWSSVPGPVAGTQDFLLDVEAVSPNNAIAVGNSIQGIERTLMMRWNGQAWSVVSSPNASAGRNYLFGVAAVGPNDIWGVGQYEQGSTILTLAERFGPAQFSDVPPDNTFYPQIMCLVCKGIISGYADGTFRPNAEVTRGQLSKIVSNAAGYNDDPGPQMFADVPPNHTFYEWVNRLARRGHIGGYPCGGAGEPCGPGNLPYFRPGANATRGQISKIVSNAAGFNDTPPAQTFEDVPLTNPFYLWIERLTQRGIMSGYQCGGTGEPCVPPDNKPYFRWANNATRGQTSKIVANTFFPSCRLLDGSE